jgi:L-asparaginase
VEVYIEAFSAHPLERDAEELYGPPDGYILAGSGAFSETRESEDDTPVHVVTLEPEDGLYMLPYMAGRRTARPGTATAPRPGAHG